MESRVAQQGAERLWCVPLEGQESVDVQVSSCVLVKVLMTRCDSPCVGVTLSGLTVTLGQEAACTIRFEVRQLLFGRHI